MAVEFAIAVPAFLFLLLLVAAGGDWVSAAGQVSAAASDAARAASVGRSYDLATAAAVSAASYDLSGACKGGEPPPQVTPIGSNGLPADFVAAVEVRVTLSCTVDLGPFRAIGLPAAVTFTRTAVAPLDQFVQRS